MTAETHTNIFLSPALLPADHQIGTASAFCPSYPRGIHLPFSRCLLVAQFKLARFVVHSAIRSLSSPRAAQDGPYVLSAFASPLASHWWQSVAALL